MPDFPHAAVAAPHLQTAEAGQEVLAQGGNAIEAMVAMAASIAVVYPHMNGIGGDGFWLVREPGGRVRGIEACGPAGALATIGRYRDRGYAAIPPRGPDAMVTVAGAVGGWAAALEWSAARGGRLPLATLLARAIAQARDGVAVSASEARYAPPPGDTLHAAPNFAATFREAGRPWRRGETRRLPALAATLERLAAAGLADFYRGDLARAVAADLEALGAPVTIADLAAYEPAERAPLQLRRRDATLFAFPPPTQGLAALLILGIFDRLGVTQGESVAHFHGLIEATKRAFAIRDRVVTDFVRLRHDPASFLTPERLQAEAGQIDMARAASLPLRHDQGGTIWMGAIDASGLAVSYIQSVYWEYGSGTVLPRTGIVWQNRGVSFSLDPASVNPLDAGAAPVPHADPRTGGVRGRPRDGLRFHGRRRPAAVPVADLHALRRLRHGARRRRGRTPAAVWQDMGGRFADREGRGPLRSGPGSGAARDGPRHGAARRRPRRHVRPCGHAGTSPRQRPRGGGARPALGWRCTRGVIRRQTGGPTLPRTEIGLRKQRSKATRKMSRSLPTATHFSNALP